MDIYQKNMEILRARFPHILVRLLGKKDARFKVESSKKENRPTILASDQRGKYYLHSLYDPQEEARRLIQSVDYNAISSLWVMGTGMGYHIMELLNRRHTGFITVIFESDLNLFDVFLHTNVAAEALQWPYFLFTAGSKEELMNDVESILQTKVNFGMGKAHFLLSPGFERYDGATYREITNKAITFTKYRYNALGNSVDDTLDGIKNSFVNVEIMAKSPGIRQLEGKYRDVPAILVAAGPSLDKNIDLIAEAKGKALVISSDTTFPILLKKGIIPDLVVTIERIPEVYERFYKGVEIPEETWLAALNVAVKEVFESFPDRNLLAFRTTEPLSRWLDNITGKKGGLDTGLSVAHLAFSIAQIAGCEPIILVGQDLALAESGQYYVSGTEDVDGKGDSSAEVWLKDYNGRPIKSTLMLRHFLNWFETTLRGIKVKCIDATEGGAYIEGTEVMTLREALDRYCLPSHGFSPIGEVVGETTPISMSYVLDEVKKFKGDFDAIIDQIEEGMDQIDNLEKQEGLEIKKLAVQMQEILNDVFLKITYRGRVAFSLQAITSTAMTRLSSRGQLVTDEEIKDFINYVRIFFKDLTQTSEVCIYTLDSIILDLKKRIQKERKEERLYPKELMANV